mgnify:CR=1 FL=1
MDALLVGGGLAAGGWLLNSKKDNNTTKKNVQADSVYDNTLLDSRLLERQTIDSHLKNNNVITQGLDRPQSGRNTMSLTGEIMSSKDFTHNNMVPFFGSNIRQNTDVNSSANTILENFTGRSSVDLEKKEISPMFDNQRENIYGTRKLPDSIKDRYEASRYNQGVPITDPIIVGPGLNKGYTANPSGGFQQEDTLKYAQQPTVNELRTKNNPKITYEGRVVNGFKGTRRGIQPVVKQNRQIRFHSFENNPRLNTTVVTNAPRATEHFIDKQTNRQNTLSSYTAPAGPAISKNAQSHIEYENQTSSRQSLDNFGFRNVQDKNRESKLTLQYCSDVRKEDKPDNTYLGQASSLVQNIIAPLQDVLRPTIKETNIHDSSTNRNLGSVIKGVPVYDPNDLARPTIKETNIHDTREGFIGKSKQAIHNYNPDDTTRTTTKETLIHDNRLGPLGGIQSSLYQEGPPELKVTARETLKDYINNINLKGNTQNSVNKVIPPGTTIKETTINNQYPGLATSIQGKGYTTNCMTAPPTNKQYTADIEYSGNVQGQLHGGYSVTKTEAPNTSRQFTSDYEYTGNAEGEIKPTSYSDIYNATLNEIKEGISKGREPTQTGLKKHVDTYHIGNIDSKPGLIQRQTMSAATPIQNIPLNSSQGINTTNDRCDLESTINNRNDPNNLAPFQNNPYTKSLNSIA